MTTKGSNVNSPEWNSGLVIREVFNDPEGVKLYYQKNHLTTFTKLSKKNSKSFSEFPQPKLKRKLENASASFIPIAVSTCDGKVVAELQAEPLEMATL